MDEPRLLTCAADGRMHVWGQIIDGKNVFSLLATVAPLDSPVQTRQTLHSCPVVWRDEQEGDATRFWIPRASSADNAFLVTVQVCLTPEPREVTLLTLDLEQGLRATPPRCLSVEQKPIPCARHMSSLATYTASWQRSNSEPLIRLSLLADNVAPQIERISIDAKDFTAISSDLLLRDFGVSKLTAATPSGDALVDFFASRERVNIFDAARLGTLSAPRSVKLKAPNAFADDITHIATWQDGKLERSSPRVAPCLTKMGQAERSLCCQSRD